MKNPDSEKLYHGQNSEKSIVPGDQTGMFVLQISSPHGTADYVRRADGEVFRVGCKKPADAMARAMTEVLRSGGDPGAKVIAVEQPRIVAQLINGKWVGTAVTEPLMTLWDRAFGTTTLPLPYTKETTPETVYDELKANNPAYAINVIPDVPSGGKR
jgi:hypothetical protein